HDTFNQVYLRSVARSVADHIGVDRNDMMEALEAALAGTYAGQLASAYLGEAPEDSSAPDAAADDLSAEAAADSEVTRPDDAPEASVAPGAAAAPADVHAAQAADYEEATAGDQKGTTGDEQDATPAAPLSERPPTEGGGATAEASTAEASHRQPLTRRAVRATEDKQPATVRARPVWPFVAGGIIAVAALILLVVALQSDNAPEPTPPVSEEVTPVDTAAEATAPSGPDAAANARDEASAAPELGDTLTVEVVAAFDRVDPIRIRVDDDLRRPYWIEEGESRSFSAVNQIILENQLENIELRLDGVPVPTDERDAQGRIVITRERAEQLLLENAPSS
ncbi:MAG: hypothetical protein GVY15_06895, partial [Bacteroidetes bacterium]|nr:hypothetical protein [Bacteroidota bacterium]